MNFLPSKFTVVAFLLLTWTIVVPSESLGAQVGKKRETKISKPTPGNVDSKKSSQLKSATNKDQHRKGSVESAKPTSGQIKSKQSVETSAQRRRQTLRLAESERRAEAERVATLQKNHDRELRDDVQAMIAKDDLSGEDPEVRQVALNALGNRAGTVVVMDPKTGRVYSIVNQEWAVREGFKPCSTIKLVTGLAGLNEEVIEPSDSLNISHSGNSGLTTAMAYSRNGYFQQVGGQVGFEKMRAYSRLLGLGEKTGINIDNEFAGYIPGEGARSGIARMSSHGDNFQVTPLQLATMVSAIGNGGSLLKPVVIRSRQDEQKFRAKVRRQIPIESEVWQNLTPGMVGAVNYGSGRKAHDPSQTVAGKTGTCIERGGWVGLFTSYAPLANPTLAVVVITRGADAHNHSPAAVAGRIYRDLNSRFGSSAHLPVASTRKSFTTEPGVSRSGRPQAGVVYISESDRNEMGNRTPLVTPKDRLNQSQVKPVLMQVPPQTRAARPQTSQPEPESSVRDGNTRPRRVSSL